MDALLISGALDGPQVVHSAALAAAATRSRFEVGVEGTLVAGVAVLGIKALERQRGIMQRGYSLVASTAGTDEVAERFEDELRCLVRVVEADVRLRRLGGEIQRTARRVNALREVIVPRLVDEARHIETLLDEREREEHTRLKHLKRQRTHVR